MKYRREIDGLRAVAVVPVILFHAGFGVLSGGFVGVDVFFVISGYLITSIILTERAAGTFSISGFYERRARRILPALYVVVAACVPFAWIWMPPEPFAAFSRSVAATVLFLSNVHFWETSGYFAPATELQPLLHTWSLAVEEQFYLIFPPLLLLIGTQRKGRTALILATLAFASLMLAEWGWRHKPDANFYFTFSRLWELMVGALCAIALFGRGPYSSDSAAGAGLALIAFSVVWFDKTIPFPSLYTLLPVIGTALIILFADGSTQVARLLSLKPFVGIGLISFSAYLWHQPLFAFTRSLSDPGLGILIGLSLLTFCLAYLSWRFVEQPFRRNRSRLLPTRGAVFAVSLLGMGMFVIFGLYGERSGGAPSRIAPNGLAFEAMALDPKLAANFGLGEACTTQVARATTSAECRTSKRPSALLWGDSYAMHLADALKQSAAAKATGFQQITKSQCWPVLNIAWPDHTAEQAAACMDFNDGVLNWVSQQTDIKTVILSSPFQLPDRLRLRDGTLVDNPKDAYAQTQILATVDALRALGKSVVIISPPPTTGGNLGLCLTNASVWGKDLSRCDFSTADFAATLQRAYDLLHRVEPSVPVVFLPEEMCHDDLCAAADNGVFMYRDAGHLSIDGSALLGQKTDLLGLALARAAGSR